MSGDHYRRELAAIFAVFALFILAAYFSQRYAEELMGLMYVDGLWGQLVYVLLAIVSVVLAPISTFPLLPIAVTLWGSALTALMSIFGWTVGGVIAFVLARRFGQPLARRFVDVGRAHELARVVTGENPFWTVVVLRMLVPVDILSYAIGLFVPMSLASYALATLIGVAPFAIIFSYAAELPLGYQAAVLVFAAGIAVVGYRRVRKALQAGGAHDTL